MKSDSPLAPFERSGSVRSSTASTSARPAKVHQALGPSITQPSWPSTVARVARHFTPATSDPMSGSVTEMPAMISPEASFGSQCCFCSSVPPPRSAFARISGRVISEPAAASDARESSSVVRIIARLPISTPPYCSGIERPKNPSSAIFSMNSSGIVSSWRWMCSACGATSTLANSRT